MDPAELGRSADEEIEEFNRERARIRQLIGRIGGVRYSRIDTLVNIAFIVLVVGLFLVELTLHPFPTAVSVEIGIFLVSMKIVWMIHANQKYNHFVFWVLNSLEYRLNENAKSLGELSRMVSDLSERTTSGKEGTGVGTWGNTAVRPAAASRRGAPLTAGPAGFTLSPWSGPARYSYSSPC